MVTEQQMTEQQAQEQQVQERQLVVFELADQRYGVDIGTVREIIRMSEITHVPDAPPSVEGVINLRGTVIPVVDLRKRFGLRVSESTTQSRVVVVEIGDESFGVVVDAVAEVLRIPGSSVEAASAIVTTTDSFYIDGIAKVGDQLLILLDLEKALSAEALQRLAPALAELAAAAAVEEDEHGEDEDEDEDEHDEDAATVQPDETHEDEEVPAPAELDLDIELLEQTFAAVAPRGDELVEYFYDQLFMRYPDVQPLFEGVDMQQQQGKLLAALATIVASLRDPDTLVAHLQELGRRHVDYGAEPEHYEAVGAVLLDSLAYIAGDGWTVEAQQAWTAAYEVVSTVMIAAALAFDERQGEQAA